MQHPTTTPMTQCLHMYGCMTRQGTPAADRRTAEIMHVIGGPERCEAFCHLTPPTKKPGKICAPRAKAILRMLTANQESRNCPH